MPRPLHIVVMLGGPSAERDVSLRSGTAVARALRSVGHTVSELDPRGRCFTLPAATDLVFLVLHGTYGEDGTIQEELERLHVPYTGSGPQASRIGFDKALTKKSCEAAGVPTPRWIVLDRPDSPIPAGFEPPLVLKPLRQGSSVGLQFVNDLQAWPTALAEAFRFDHHVLVEEKINGREATVGILDDKALPIVEVRPKKGVYDYANKYTPGATEYFCPASFPPEVASNIQRAALGAFRAIGARDYARVDVMVPPDGRALLLEVNTLPGMTETSLLPKAAAAAGLDYAQLCQRMVDLAWHRSGQH